MHNTTNTSGPSWSMRLHSFLKALHGAIISHKPHKPELVVVDRNHLYVLLRCVHSAC